MLRLKIGDYVAGVSLPGHGGGAPTPCVWDSEKLINPHLIICGKTGTGKSFTLKKVFGGCAVQDVRVHVFDPHGDLNTDDPSQESVSVFSNKTQIGFNPLEVNTHEHTGGVRTTINYFISLLETVDRKLQVRQKNVLRSLLEELYANRGITDEDPSSWAKKRITPSIRAQIIAEKKRSELRGYYPTLDDLIDFAAAKYQVVFGIGDSSNENAKRTAFALKSLKTTYQKIRKIKSNLNKLNDPELALEYTKLENEIAVMRDDAKTNFSLFVDNITTGGETEDMVNYEYKETFSSILIRLKDLKGSGIFSGNVPQFDESKKIWRYDIHYLPDPEKKLLVYYVMNKIFNLRRDMGPQDTVRDIIVVDEAHKFMEDDGTSIFNLIAKEARKFGLGLWCASQNPEHFSQDFLCSVGTKILLGVDPILHPKVSQNWDISKEELSRIVAKQTFSVYMDKNGAKNPRFQLVSAQKPRNLQVVGG